MRKHAVALGLAALLTASVSSPGVAANQPLELPRVYINGAELELPADQKPFIEQGRTMVPMRAIFEALGAQVHWDGTTRTVVGQKGEVILHLPIGADKAEVAGYDLSLSQPAMLVRDRTFVPLRFVSEAFGAQVAWFEDSRRVFIVRHEATPAWAGLLMWRAAGAPGSAYSGVDVDTARRVITLRFLDRPEDNGNVMAHMRSVFLQNPRLAATVNREGWRVELHMRDAQDRVWNVEEIPFHAPVNVVGFVEPAWVTKSMVRVAAPAPDQLSEQLRREMGQLSASNVADNFSHWRHTGEVYQGPYLAPGLAEKLTPVTERAKRSWTRHLGSWQEGDRFYFRLQVTAEREDGTFTPMGIDTIEVSSVPNAGPIVTGYAHEEWTGPSATEEMSVWVAPFESQVKAPRRLLMPHGAVKSGDTYLIPVRTLQQFTKVVETGTGTYAVVLPDEKQTAPLSATPVNGLDYLPVDRLIEVLNGKSGSSVNGSYKYGAAWQAETRQLILRLEEHYPIS